MLALRGITLQDNAIIRFFSVGNNAVGIMRLSDGTPIPANTDYAEFQSVVLVLRSNQRQHRQPQILPCCTACRYGRRASGGLTDSHMLTQAGPVPA